MLLERAATKTGWKMFLSQKADSHGKWVRLFVTSRKQATDFSQGKLPRLH